MLEEKNINELTPYAKNARTHSETQLKLISGSIEKFGFINPVLINSNGGILAGHGRVEAAKRLGMETVPCRVISHLNEQEQKEYILADNQLATLSEWDVGLLADELDGIDDIHALGFDDSFLLDEVNAVDMPMLRTAEEKEFEQKTFTFHVSQIDIVERAMKISKGLGVYGDTGNENSNGNAMARICELFVMQHESNNNG